VLSTLRGRRAPALIVAPDGDFICSPPLGRRIHEALPNSTLVAISNAGHFPWLEQPEQFWRAVDLGLDAYLTPV
jgi:pimeloyl-ACP methyl ester carboxylesterase